MDHEPCDKGVYLLLTETTHKAAAEIAHQIGLPVSTWIRTLVVRAVRQASHKEES